MNDLSRSVIDLAISTIKKTHHGVTIASVSGKFQPDKEVKHYCILMVISANTLLQINGR